MFTDNSFYVPEAYTVLCTLYGAVDFLIVPFKGLYVWWVGGSEYVMLLYIPLGPIVISWPKKSQFQGPTLPMALIMDIA
jgi:hypothetical protein